MQPREVLNLDFSINGVVIAVLADVGQQVQPGDVLARLDTTSSTCRLSRRGLRLLRREPPTSN
ncbi:MAG: biotin/lipoyl-binding protein [Chloroflexaceae bacterium]|nr:biotin/lipoyl-binding protein [Chloroflexaceae bacterium]